VNLFELVNQDWPITVFAWYGDSGFVKTLLNELGWTVRSETSELGADDIDAMFDDISDTLPFTEHTDRLIFRSLNRWNLLIWRNDSGNSLAQADSVALPMPVYEFTFAEKSSKVQCTLALDTLRRVLISQNGVVDKRATIAYNQVTAERDYSFIESNGICDSVTWILRLTNSLGLPATKSMTIIADPKQTLINMGATLGLFELDGESMGKLSVLVIDDLE
jgi:hypothetical protein